MCIYNTKQNIGTSIFCIIFYILQADTLIWYFNVPFRIRQNTAHPTVTVSDIAHSFPVEESPLLISRLRKNYECHACILCQIFAANWVRPRTFRQKLFLTKYMYMSVEMCLCVD